MPFANETPLEDVLKYIKTASESPQLPDGIPIYVDPAGLTEAEKTMTSPVTIDLNGVSLKTTLRLILRPTRPDLHGQGRPDDDHLGDLDRPADRDPRLSGRRPCDHPALADGWWWWRWHGRRLAAWAAAWVAWAAAWAAWAAAWAAWAAAWAAWAAAWAAWRSLPVQDPSLDSPYLEKKSN